jgi:hypothetical protein
MRDIIVDIMLPMAGIALVGFMLHNPKQVTGTLATVTSIYTTGVKDIKG